MHKLLLLCLLLLLTISPLHAQRTWEKLWKTAMSKPTQSKTKLMDLNISRQLDLRMNQTFRQAKQAQMQLPPNSKIMMGNPILQIFNTEELHAHELYPQQTFLTNSAQTGKYLVARNNRLFVQEIRRTKQVLAQINENLPRMRQEAVETEQPADAVDWLANLLPPTTTQLFIGEIHGYPEIHQFVARLTQELRLKQPTRKIILFTEFLPENFKWTGQYPHISEVPEIFSEYYSVWRQALKAGIPTIGLELPAVMNSACHVRYLNKKGTLNKKMVWDSLEGIRLRNEHWKKTLSAYRAQYPDALFIIYTGAAHCLYNRSFTLASTEEQTFVSILYPDQYTSFVDSGPFAYTLVAKPMPGPLERLVDQLDFERPIIKWQSPDLAPIAGFDVRIKLPVSLPGIDK